MSGQFGHHVLVSTIFSKCVVQPNSGDKGKGGSAAEVGGVEFRARVIV